MTEVESSENVKMCNGKEAGENDLKILQNWDLMPTMMQYWDIEMVIMVLKWMLQKKNSIYKKDDILEALKSSMQHTLVETAWSSEGLSPPAEWLKFRDIEGETFKREEETIRTFLQCTIEYKNEYRKDQSGVLEQKSINEWARWWDDLNHREREKPANLDSSSRSTDHPENPPVPQTQFPSDVGLHIISYTRKMFMNGMYAECIRWLSHMIFICDVTTDMSSVKMKQLAYWGLFAASILSLPETHEQFGSSHSDDNVVEAAGKMTTKIDEASKTASYILKIDELIEKEYENSSTSVSLSSLSSYASSSNSVAAMNQNKQAKLTSMQRKTWLLHWTIWPIFRFYLPNMVLSGNDIAPKLVLRGKDLANRNVAFSELTQWFFNEKCVNTVVLTCPHLLRYYAIFAIFNWNHQAHCKTIVNNAVNSIRKSNGKAKLDDPFIELIQALVNDIDFDKAQQKLLDCARAAENDFFLCSLKSRIEEHSRLVLFETYCRIHSSINIDMIAEKLNMTQTMAEKWIVNLIRLAKLDAKIDSERNRVEITSEKKNIYQKILDCTRHVIPRCKQLVPSQKPVERAGR